MTRDLKFDSALNLRKNRAESGLFLAEGRRVVEDGLRSGCPCEVVFVREGFFGRHEETDALLSVANTVILSDKDFMKLSDTEAPQGLIGVFQSGSLLGSEPEASCLPALFDVADPRNLGGIVRSADWFGFTELLLGESCVDPFNGKAVRSSMGAVFRTRFLICDDLEGRLAALKSRYRIVVADLDGRDYREFHKEPDSIFVFSNEARGPSEAILALADDIAAIPGSGRGESLSVAVAAAVMMASLS
ncbi:MAG: RNA methyltransferase [Spirochaetota bacterium]